MTGERARDEAAERLVSDVWDEAPDVYLLALVASLAARIDTALLRRLRRGLGPALRRWTPTPPLERDDDRPVALTAATEGRLWFSALATGRGPASFSLRPAVARVLRARLAADGLRCRLDGGRFVGADDGAPAAESLSLLDAAWAITERRHHTLPGHVCWEERLAWLLTPGRGEPAGEPAIAEWLNHGLAVLFDPSLDARASRSAAGWIYRALSRMPLELWRHPDAWWIGLRAARQASPPGSPPFDLPLDEATAPGFDRLRDSRPLAGGAPRAAEDFLPPDRTGILVARVDRRLRLQVEGSGAEGEVRLPIPSTRPLLVEVRAMEGDFRAVRAVPLPAGGSTQAGPAVWVDVPDGPLEVWSLAGRSLRLPTDVARRRPVRGPEAAHRLPAPTPLVGREDAQSWLMGWGEGPEAIGVLVGEGGSGRTALLAWLVPELVPEPTPGRLFVWRGDVDPDALRCLTHLARTLGRAGYWDLESAVRGAEHRLLIVLDDLPPEALSHREMQRLFAATRAGGPVRILVATRGEGPGRLGDAPTLAVGRLDPAAAAEVLRTRGPALNERDRADLVARLDGHPLSLSIAARWLDAAADPSSALRELTRAVAERDVPGRIEWVVRRLVETLRDGAVGALGADWRHPLVQSALKESYGEKLAAPDGHVLEPLLKLANRNQDTLLRQEILAHAGDPATEHFVSPDALALFDALDVWNPDTATERPWKFWRSCGTALGRMLKQEELKPEDRVAIVETLRRRGLTGAWRQLQVASIALSKSGLLGDPEPATRQFFEELWQRGLPRPPEEGAPRQAIHPQLAWTLAKDADRAWLATRMLEDVDHLEDWARDRLILSLLRLSEEEKSRLGPIPLGHPLSRALRRDSNRLAGLLIRWAEVGERSHHPDTVFELPAELISEASWRAPLALPDPTILDENPPLRLPPIEEDPARDAAVRAITAAFAEQRATEAELRTWFDLASLQIEVAVTSGYAGGRYNMFEHLTGVAITVAGARADAVADALCGCHDEGVRWGLAQRMGTALGEDLEPWGVQNLWDLVEPDRYWSVAGRLVEDENEWVPRDTLDGVCQVYMAHHATSAWRPEDDLRLARLADAVAAWLDARMHSVPEFRADVLQRVEKLRVMCRPFGERWWRLRSV